MIAVDTNVLLRLYTNDLPDLAQASLALLERCEREGTPVFIAVPVLVETIANLAWRRYRFSRADIARVVETMLASTTLVIDQRDAVAAALADYRGKPGDFIDHLIRRIALAAGAGPVHTFDQELHGDRGFAAL